MGYFAGKLSSKGEFFLGGSSFSAVDVAVFQVLKAIKDKQRVGKVEAQGYLIPEVLEVFFGKIEAVPVIAGMLAEFPILPDSFL